MSYQIKTRSVIKLKEELGVALVFRDRLLNRFQEGRVLVSQLLKCPSCRTRLVPHPEEMRSLRLFAGLTQREMAGLLGVKASHVAYLENGRRLPSGALILRYRKVERMLLSKLKRKLASESREVRAPRAVKLGATPRESVELWVQRGRSIVTAASNQLGNL